MPKSGQNSSSSKRSKTQKNVVGNNSNTDSANDNAETAGNQAGHGEDTSSKENPNDLITDEEEEDNDNFPRSEPQRSIKLEGKQKDTSSNTSPSSLSKNSYRPVIFSSIIIIAIIAFFINSNSDSNSCSNDKDWRLKVDPHNRLSDGQRNMICAALKPILDKCSAREEDVGVSTLLILSSNEESATKLTQCLLELVNTKKNKDQVSTEINLQSHSGGKLKLDSNLRTLLNTTDDAIRAVLLRHIDKIPPNDEFEQLRLLFAYCDGENPVIPHRLIIMTATSDSENENELREKFKTRFPNEHDFVDALMSRISGHTLYVEKDRQSIC